MAEQEVISSQAFYGEYHGHKINHLKILYPRLRAESSKGIIWTAGDSSLDNKYWFEDEQPAIDGAYADVLRPPTSICDVTYWLNYYAQQQAKDTSNTNTSGGGVAVQRKWGAINTAVEATTLNERALRLLPQDRFIRDNISEEDVLVVSICGNDIALYPTPCTIASMAGLLCLPKSILRGSCTSCTVSMQDCCCGCGASFASCLGSCPPCLGYFSHLFGTRVQKYIEALTSKTKPKKVLVCMIYYPGEEVVSSWAGPSLAILGYNRDPSKLQLLINTMFKQATSRINVPGTQVIPIPLYQILDSKNSSDYVARVEPSATGGKKMAEYLFRCIDGDGPFHHMDAMESSSPSSPLMSDR